MKNIGFLSLLDLIVYSYSMLLDGSDINIIEFESSMASLLQKESVSVLAVENEIVVTVLTTEDYRAVQTGYGGEGKGGGGKRQS